MSLSSYYREADSLARRYPLSSKGEIYMRVLKRRRPDVYTWVVGSDCDPTDDDSRLGAFRREVNRRWYRGDIDDDPGPRRRSEDKPEVITINLNLDWPFF